MIEGIVIIINHNGSDNYFVSTLQGIFKPTNASTVIHSSMETKKRVMIETINGQQCKIVQTVNVDFDHGIQKTIL